MLALEDGRTGVVGRIHHAMADGVTAIRIAAGLLWDLPEKRTAARPPRGARAGGSARPSRLQRPPSTRRCRRSASPGSREPFAASRPGADTPLDQHIGSEREIAWTVVPLAAPQADRPSGGRGITINDVVLAVVAGGLRRVAPRRGLAARQPPRPGPGLPSPP